MCVLPGGRPGAAAAGRVPRGGALGRAARRQAAGARRVAHAHAHTGAHNAIFFIDHHKVAHPLHRIEPLADVFAV